MNYRTWTNWEYSLVITNKQTKNRNFCFSSIVLCFTPEIRKTPPAKTKSVDRTDSAVDFYSFLPKRDLRNFVSKNRKRDVGRNSDGFFTDFTIKKIGTVLITEMICPPKEYQKEFRRSWSCSFDSRLSIQNASTQRSKYGGLHSSRQIRPFPLIYMFYGSDSTTVSVIPPST